MTPSRDSLLDALQVGAARLPLSLTDTQAGKLIDYLQLLAKWNAVYNLTAIRDPLQMVTQHLLDSLAIVPFVGTAHRVLDVGAGGGLPGIVLAIWAAESHPAMEVNLIDTVHKKTAFLTQVKAELGLSQVSVHTGRVEAMPASPPFDLITSRAFAELRDFVTWSGHLLAPGGRFAAMKGQLPEQEIAQLPAGWQVSRIERLDVPGVDAQRHLIWIERAGT